MDKTTAPKMLLHSKQGSSRSWWIDIVKKNFWHANCGVGNVGMLKGTTFCQTHLNVKNTIGKTLATNGRPHKGHKNLAGQQVDAVRTPEVGELLEWRRDTGFKRALVGVGMRLLESSNLIQPFIVIK